MSRLSTGVHNKQSWEPGEALPHTQKQTERKTDRETQGNTRESSGTITSLSLLNGEVVAENSWLWFR